MANYNQVSFGSGDKGTVTELQKLLNNNGYSLDTDGIFGEKTQAAVKDYQGKNGLQVDGIVGSKTWGALTNASNTSAQTQTQAPAKTEVKAPTFEYTKSDAVAQAEALLQQQLSNKPGEYQSTWQEQLNDTLQQILNREKFSYDLNGDMLYQQYKDQYTTQGKLAMMDTMGQAAAMTGGYGNSYAQTAGQQAYQGYLQQLNDKVPELYALALDKYNQEGQAMYDQASLMAQMEDQEYGRYRDTLSDYYTDLNYLTENARYMSETEYNQALQDFNIKYASYRDTVGDQQWQTSFDYQKEQDKIANDLAIQQLNETIRSNKAREANDAASLQQKQQEAYEERIEKAGKSDEVDAFKTKMADDTEYWDAIMRHQYGSEKTYIAQQIEKATLSDDEKAYLISYYGITENDLHYKTSHS